MGRDDPWPILVGLAGLVAVLIIVLVLLSLG
jgi:hypothetical protein